MAINNELKEKAIKLRRAGLTYSEILLEISVAKSTLSDWLYSVGLSKKQKQRITEKRLASALKGASVKKAARLARVQKILTDSSAQIKNLSSREQWLIGVALYWAEGSKEKDWHPGSPLVFSNSDPEMIRYFLFWLQDSLNISRDDIHFHLYLHDMYKEKAEKIISFWIAKTGFERKSFEGVYFKRNKDGTVRKNVGDNYTGVLRVIVRRSSEYTRMVAGWVNGIVQFIR